jgi:hypothetical protein
MGSNIPEGCNGFKIDWDNLTFEDLESIAEQLPPLDSIFFNQNYQASLQLQQYNYSGRDLRKETRKWEYCHWINCQVPVYLIKLLKLKIAKDTRVGWQLGWGNTLYLPKEDNQWKHTLYGIGKMENLIIMRGFSQSHHGIFYATHPGDLAEEVLTVQAKAVFAIQQGIGCNNNGDAIDYTGAEYLIG